MKSTSQLYAKILLHSNLGSRSESAMTSLNWSSQYEQLRDEEIPYDVTFNLCEEEAFVGSVKAHKVLRRYMMDDQVAIAAKSFATLSLSYGNLVDSAIIAECYLYL